VTLVVDGDDVEIPNDRGQAVRVARPSRLERDSRRNTKNKWGNKHNHKGKHTQVRSTTKYALISEVNRRGTSRSNKETKKRK
jgi:hypothetical protein